MWRVLTAGVCGVGLIVALAGAAAGLAAVGLWAADVIGSDFTATLGVVSILCALAAVPIGIVGWRWAERRHEWSVLGQAASLIGGTTLLAWFAVLFYALSQDTP
jgi:hypothetical protein